MAKLLFLFLSCCSFHSIALAQGWPLPSDSPGVEVPCPASAAACIGQENKPTAAWSSPIVGFGGRYLDSHRTRGYQFTFRTARAGVIRVAPERSRIYMIVGSALAAYDLDSFYSRLAAREAMMRSTAIPVSPPNQRTGDPEEVLRWDEWFYAESGGGWQTPFADGQERLFGFDWDDRGNVYLAYSIYGWGLVRDTGSRGVVNGTGTRMASVLQHVTGTNDVNPMQIISVKSAGEYYAIVSPDVGSASNVWHLSGTSTIVEERRPDAPFTIFSYAKARNGTQLGVVDMNGQLKIFSNDSILSGTPIFTLVPSVSAFSAIDTDGSNFFALESGGFRPVVLHVITPMGGSYVSRSYSQTFAYGGFGSLRFGGGYLTVFGSEYIGVPGNNLRVFRLDTLVPTELPAAYFSRYYASAAGPSYAHPIGIGFNDGLIDTHLGANYLLLAASGLGDVYQLNLPVPQSDAGIEVDGGTTRPSDAGAVDPVDGGTDAGPRGGFDGGAPAGPPPEPVPRGCGCSTSEALSGLISAMLMALAASRSRARR